MAMTLAESAELSQDKLQRGIIEELIKESPLMARYPFISLVGNALAINREDAANPPSVAFRAVDGVWTETTGKTVQVSYPLKILGGDCDVDNFLQQTRSNVNDLMAAQVKMKAKQMAHTFEDTCIYGNATGTNEYDGYHTWLNLAALNAQEFHAGAGGVGAALTLALLDEAIDSVKSGKPDFILMNKTIRRLLTAYLRANGSYEVARDDFGVQNMVWGDIPILTTDWLVQTETIVGTTYSAKTGSDTCSVFIVHLGELDGIVGLQNGSIETEVWDKLEVKDASRTRIKWYVSQAIYTTLCIARIDGITAVAVTA